MNVISKYGFLTPTTEKFNEVSKKLKELGATWEVSIDDVDVKDLFNLAKTQTCVVLTNQNELTYSQVSSIPEYVEFYEIDDFIREKGNEIKEEIKKAQRKKLVSKVEFDVLNRQKITVTNQNFVNLTDEQKTRVAQKLNDSIQEILIEEYMKAGHLNVFAMSYFQSTEFWTELKRRYDMVIPENRGKFLRDLDSHVLSIIDDSEQSGQVILMEKARECLDLLTVPRFKGDIMSAEDLFGDRFEL